MIAPARLREKLHGRPFRPFRLFLSDGSKHDVPHPEFAWVYGTRVFVGTPHNNGFPDDAPLKELSILHITRIEDLPKKKTKK